MKVLYCRDAGFDCNAIVRGRTDEEILSQVRPHAKQAHQVDVDSAMEHQLKTLMRAE